jgi:hypothetical protein
MALHASEHAARHPRRGRALLIAALSFALLSICSALLPASIATAAAKTSKTKASSETQAQSASGATGAPAAGTAGETETAAAAHKDKTETQASSTKDGHGKQTPGGASTSGSAGSAHAGGSPHASGSGRGAGATATGSGAAGASADKHAQARKGQASAGDAHKQAAKTGEADAPESQQAGGATPALMSVEASARKPGKGHEKEKGGGKGHEAEKGGKGKVHKQPHGKTEEPPAKAQESGQEHSGATAGAATAAAEAPLAAPIDPAPAIATDATPPPVLEPAGPAVVGSFAQAARARRARARAHTGGAIAAGVPVAAATLAPLTALVASSARAGKRVHPLAGRRPPSSRGPVTPLVTTITKIVDVVPTPVRALIAALLALALALAARSRMAAVRARRLERQRTQLLEDVGLLQAALLPVPPARLGPVGTSVAYRPADGPGAGGDFYDVFALENGQLGVIVGDISGHGRQALPHTALVRFTLRAYLEAGLSPRVALQTAAAVLAHQLEGSFATVVVATYEPRERTLSYACAGHPAPVVLGSGARSTPLVPVTACSAPPIGVGMRTGTRQTVVSLPGRSQVCFYTDGVTEARVGVDLFGPERLARTLRELGPGATAATVLGRVAEETDRRPDDMAACLLSVEGAAAGPRALVEELELGREDAAGERAGHFLLACGVEREEVAELMRSALRAAGRSGAAILEVRVRDGAAPEVLLQQDNISHLHARLDRPARRARMSR